MDGGRDAYFLRLFLWFAAIFSFAVNGAGFVPTAPDPAPGTGVSLALSDFFPLPFGLSISLMRDDTVQGMIYLGWR